MTNDRPQDGDVDEQGRHYVGGKWRTQDEIRAMAEYSVAETLRAEGPLSRADVSRWTGLAEAAAARAIDACLADGRIAAAGDGFLFSPERIRSLAQRWAFREGGRTETDAASFRPRQNPRLTDAERRELVEHVGRRITDLERTWASFEPAMERVAVALGEELGLGLSDALGRLIDLALDG